MAPPGADMFRGFADGALGEAGFAAVFPAASDACVAAGGGPSSFAERLRRIGAQFDREFRQSAEDSAQRADREVQLAREEADWLHRQLEGERQQSAARLGLCAELQRQLEEAQQQLRREVQERERWQRECAALEERHSLLEAKLAAVALSEAEAEAAGHRDDGDRGVGGAEGAHNGMRVEENRLLRLGVPAGWQSEKDLDEEEDRESEHRDMSIEEQAVQRCFRALEEDVAGGEAAAGAMEAAELCAKRLSAEGMHNLLVVAASAGDHAENGGSQPSSLRVPGSLRYGGHAGSGAEALVRRVAQLWVARLVGRRRGLALRAAARSGSAATVEVLLALGGPAAVRAAASAVPAGGVVDGVGGASTEVEAVPAAIRDMCLLSLCVEHGNMPMLTGVLDGLRGAVTGSCAPALLAAARRARSLANLLGRADEAEALAAHLIVELSMDGNTKYRHNAYEAAVASYEEAIALCQEQSGPSRASSAAPHEAGAVGGGGSELDLVHGGVGSIARRQNLVRLRYNLARALHRLDRWAEARDQATAATALDPLYVNAYALRAQAAMASFDWEAAEDDWKRLLSMAANGGCSSGDEPICEESLSLWHRRREECHRQVEIGHYEVLELPKLSSLEAVRRAYRDLARKWHPDKNRHLSKDRQERCARKFNRLREAFEALGDEASKRAYDAVLLLFEARPLNYAETAQGSRCRGAGGGDARAVSVSSASGRQPSSPSSMPASVSAPPAVAPPAVPAMGASGALPRGPWANAGSLLLGGFPERSKANQQPPLKQQPPPQQQQAQQPPELTQRQQRPPHQPQQQQQARARRGSGGNGEHGGEDRFAAAGADSGADCRVGGDMDYFGMGAVPDVCSAELARTLHAASSATSVGAGGRRERERDRSGSGAGGSSSAASLGARRRNSGNGTSSQPAASMAAAAMAAAAASAAASAAGVDLDDGMLEADLAGDAPDWPHRWSQAAAVAQPASPSASAAAPPPALAPAPELGRPAHGGERERGRDRAPRPVPPASGGGFGPRLLGAATAFDGFESFEADLVGAGSFSFVGGCGPRRQARDSVRDDLQERFDLAASPAQAACSAEGPLR